MIPWVNLALLAILEQHPRAVNPAQASQVFFLRIKFCKTQFEPLTFGPPYIKLIHKHNNIST